MQAPLASRACAASAGRTAETEPANRSSFTAGDLPQGRRRRGPGLPAPGGPVAGT
jgi:hypothetical protein